MAYYRTIEEIKAAAEESGSHFFDSDTLRFFSTRVLPGVYGGHFFVTSEQCDDHPRRDTVRFVSDEGAIHTDCFQKYATAGDANRSARKAAERWGKHAPEEYVWIKKWGAYLGWPQQSIADQQRMASDQFAPLDAISSAGNGWWDTIESITNTVARRHLGLTD